MTNAMRSALSVIRRFFTSRSGALAIAQTLLTRIAVAAINLSTGVIVARCLGTAGRGDLSAMLIWPALLANLLTLGLPAAIRYWIRREPDRRSEFFTVAVLGGLAASPISIGIGCAFIPFWLRAYTPDVIHAAQLLMVFSPEMLLGVIFVCMLETIGDFATANRARYVTVVITLILLTALALSHRVTALLAALSYTSGPVLTTLWTGWFLRRHFKFRWFDMRQATRLLFSYGARSYGVDLLNTVAAQIDQVLVIAFLNQSQVGVYVVALNASRVVNILHSAVVTVLFPSAAGLSKSAAVAIVEVSARLSTAIAIAFGAALILMLPTAIPLFYGNAFSTAIPPAEVLVVEAVLGGLAYVLAQAFMALGRPAIVTTVQLIGVLATFPLMLLLLPHYGLFGAAMALLLSTVIRLLFVMVLFPTVLQVPLLRLLPTRADIHYLRVSLSKGGTRG